MEKFDDSLIFLPLFEWKFILPDFPENYSFICEINELKKKKKTVGYNVLFYLNLGN